MVQRRKTLTEAELRSLATVARVAAPYAASAAKSAQGALTDFYAKRRAGRAPSNPRRVGPKSDAGSIAAPLSVGYTMSNKSFGNPNSTGFSQMGSTGQSTRIKGQTLLGQVSSQATPFNQLVATYTLLPTLFSDRIGTIAATYDKYVFRNVTAVYTPVCATTTAGSIMMYFDRDVMDAPADASQIAQVMSAENATLGPVWSKASTTLARDPFEKRTYFTSVGSTIEPHELMQFKLHVYSLATPAAVTQLGIVTLHYDMELITPVFAPRETSALALANSQYQPFSGNVTMQLNSSVCTGVFGQPSSFWARVPIWEIIIGDLGGTGTPGDFNASVTLNTGGAQMVARVGTMLYMTTHSANASTTGATYTFYTTYQGALNRGPNLLFNTLATGQPMFNTNIPRVFARAIGSIAATPNP